MARSYLLIEENNFQIYQEPDLFKADALIMDVYDASCIFSNYNKLYDLLTHLEQEQKKLYLKLDCKHLTRCYKALDSTIGSFIAGFYLEDPSSKVLRTFNLKIREYELKQKLPYLSLSCIASIHEPYQVNHMKQIIAHPRVEDVILHPIDQVNMDYVHLKAETLMTQYKKNLIALEQITSSLSDLDGINLKYTPSKQEIADAMDVVQVIRFAHGKSRRNLLQKASLTDAYRVLYEAEALGLVSDIPIIPFIRRRKKEYILKKPLVIKKFYTVGEEIANGITHGIGVGLAIAALVLLMVKGGTTKEILAYLAFSVSAIILYLMSTLYHSLALGELSKKLFHKFDHMTIYLLIAGSYTPFSLLAIGGTRGTVICIFLWIGCLIGLLLNLFAFGRFRVFHMILYISLGWIAILFLPQIIVNLGSTGVLFLILGGVMYTVGFFFYSTNLFKFSHMTWHIFTLLGSLFHFFAVFYFL